MSPISRYIITTIIIHHHHHNRHPSHSPNHHHYHFFIITITIITILTGVEVLDHTAVIEHRSASSLVGGGEVYVLDLGEDTDLGGLFVHIVGYGGDARVHCYLPRSQEEKREGRV